MKALRRTAIGLAVLVSLMLLWLVGGNAYARYRERQVERAWVRSFGPLQELLRRYPKTAKNETAGRLEVLAKPFGLDLTPKTHESMTANLVGSEKAGGPAERGRHAVSAYLTAELEKPDAAIGPPPSEVNTFLWAHAGDFEAIQSELLTSSSPSWDFDPTAERGGQPIPDVSALIGLQRILLTRALVQSVEGYGDEARRTLDASWKLNENLRELPNISCQLLALSIARLQIGALRKVDVEASLWRARLTEHDFRQSVLDTELIDLWPSAERYRELEEIELRSEKKPLKRLETLLLRPHQELFWSEDMERMRPVYLRIKNSRLSDQEFSKINQQVAMPNLLDVIRRADRLVLDSELTAKVLQARELRLQNGSKWPAAIPGIEVSRFPGARWIYSVSPDGTMSLSLSNAPHWDTSGPVLPTRFTSS